MQSTTLEESPHFQAPSPSQTDEHAVPQHHPTQTQMTLLIVYVIIASVWILELVSALAGLDLLRRWGNAGSRDGSHSQQHLNSQPIQKRQQPEKLISKQQTTPISISEIVTVENNGTADIARDHTGGPAGDVSVEVNGPAPPAKPVQDVSKTKLNVENVPRLPVVGLDKFISSLVLFGAILFYFYLCDYVKVFPQGDRHYSRDIFLFLVFIFFLVASVFTIRSNPDKILNRDQTEEWKGWMQVMFVWYHYFSAKEWYNWIRVYIACYVWMTGFGNFSFFWIRNDYSLWRFLKMFFRLNFLVLFVAMTTNNDYMLYYICAMHTYWFFSVYLFMRIFQSWNKNRYLISIKFVVYAVCNAIIFDIPGVSSFVFRPLSFVLGLHDGKHDVMHEWTFRAGLDHWACFLGMLCAYNYPHFETFMLHLDSVSVDKRDKLKKVAIRCSLAIVCVLLGVTWYFTFMRKDKFAYNKLHPYTSIIPIVIFMVIRNLHPVLRKHHIHMFAWLGKITLETYLSQLHVYLLSNARTLLVYIPEYPLLNFSLATLGYLIISHTLFTITNDCSNFLIPKDKKKLLMNVFSLFVLFSASAFLAYQIHGGQSP